MKINALATVLFALSLACSSCSQEAVSPAPPAQAQLSADGKTVVKIVIATSSDIPGNRATVLVSYMHDEQAVEKLLDASASIEVAPNTVITLTPTVEKGVGEFKEFRIDGVAHQGNTFTVAKSCEIVALFQMEPSGVSQ